MSEELKSIKTVLIEDSKLTKKSLKRVLNEYSFIKIVGCEKDALSGFKVVEEQRPDIVLIDIYLKGVNGIGAAMKIKNEMPEVKIVLLTKERRDEEIVSALGAGANGYCLKDLTSDLIIKVIKSVTKGINWIDTGASNSDFKAFSKQKVRHKKKNYKNILTKRELEVLELLVKGQNNNEMAKKLIISVRTVKSLICSILRKFEAADRVQAAIIATKEKVV